jgi:squalene-associated FAD-dependent desaturase
VAVVGGGLAGLSAALECADAGARVTLFEARARLGGATWSTRLEGLEVDNGQHVFLRCCDAYLAFLRRLGVEDRVVLQRRLDVPVLAPGGRLARLRRHPLPRPAHLLPSLLRFAHLPLADRLRIARTARRLGALDLADPKLDGQSLGAWLAAQGESPAAVDRFWDLLVRPTLNLPARDASLLLSAVVFQTGLLSDPAAADVGWSRVPLSRLHAEPAEAALRRAGARVALRSRIEALELGGARPALLVAGERVSADAVILAAPHEDAARLLPDAAGVDRDGLRQLARSPIVNLHVVFDRNVMPLEFAAGVGTPLQWIFDRTASSGLARGQYLAVSLSAAGEWQGRSRAELRREFLPAFHALFPAAREAVVETFFATCEPAATFLQRPGTARWRPGARTAVPGLFLAGAHTATGWPATMEGAVRSGVSAARLALRAAGLRPGLAEAA